MGSKESLTLIERAGRTFESFLGREFGSRFYTDEFLTGISARRLELHARLGKASGMAFLLATMIAFFDLVAGSSFSYSGLTVQITKDLMPIIALLAASAMLQATFAFIDEQIVFRILIKIGARIDVHNLPLLLVDKAAINLWGDAITLRYFGLKSGTGQRVALLLQAVIAILAGLAMYLYPAAMVGFATYQAFQSSDNWIAQGIALLACLIATWALSLGVIFNIRFKFYPADWVESTNVPTPEFAEKMRTELAAREKEGAPGASDQRS